MAEKKILVVDDEQAIISLLEQAFSRKGYEVWSALDAETALEILENQTIYVMFFDLNLPGMNGIALCREIKKRRPVSVIYAITGYASLFELADCRDAGFEDYFKKPVNLSTLMDKAASAFEKIERWKNL